MFHVYHVPKPARATVNAAYQARITIHTGAPSIPPLAASSPLLPIPKNIAFSHKNLNFKARFWVREERRKTKKEERADRNRSLSTIACTGPFVVRVRGKKTLTPTSAEPSYRDATSATQISGEKFLTPRQTTRKRHTLPEPSKELKKDTCQYVRITRWHQKKKSLDTQLHF